MKHWTYTTWLQSIFFLTIKYPLTLSEKTVSPKANQNNSAFFLTHQFQFQFSHSVVSNSLQPHESQHARTSYSSPSPGVHSDSHPSSPWCHPAISSSVVPFSSCPQSLPASVFSNESDLHMRWPKYWSITTILWLWLTAYEMNDCKFSYYKSEN